ncbi:MAG: glycosyl transferase, partial [Lachnospiraceae bacterium]|nr:glycosyl transferase [Lachnospiraceae bacterium]
PPIPGCETRNRAFFADNGLAVRADITDEGLDDALSLMADPDAQEAMAACQAALIRPDAAERICRLAEDLCGA